ncbi:MAG: serine/threonine protein kinase [Microvirga sp.]
MTEHPPADHPLAEHPLAETLHAGCVVVGEAGILIRGAAGAGKSSLGRDIVLQARRRHLFALLVSDDRTLIANRHGRLVASPPAAIAGRVEVRGTGIIRQPFEPAAVLRLVIDLSADPPDRYPEESDRVAGLCGVMLPRLRAQIGAPLADIVLERLSADGCDPVVTL